MAQCAACGKNILMGGVKEGEARYCNQTCRGNAFIERFNAALERAIAFNAEPIPAAQPSSMVSAGSEATADPDTIARGAGELGVSGAGLAVRAAVVALIWFIHEKARDVVGFPQFLQAVVENQRVQFRHGAPIDLGKWGYGRFVINLAGFAFGVMATVAIAGGKAYCTRCGRYLTTVGSQSRTSSNPEAMAQAIAPVIAKVNAGRIQDALDLHAAWDAGDRNGFVTTKIAVETSTGCGMHLGTLTAVRKSDNNVAPVLSIKFQAKTHERVLIPG